MSRDGERSVGGKTETESEYQLRDVFEQLDELERSVTDTQQRRDIRRTRRMLERVPGGERIKKYTSRDIAEGFVGGIIFSVPLLVEDGVFEIAEWFLNGTVGSIPILLVGNVVFVVGLVAGLLYYTDIRDVQIGLLFGFLPKRLTGVLVISFLVAAGTMLFWGRLHAEDPTTLEQFGRITVIWTAAALGATLGDILPGESKGEDVTKVLSEFGDRAEDTKDENDAERAS